MPTPRVLWLCSWYPNQEHPFDGDFIQRQAEALASLQELEVIYVHKSFSEPILRWEIEQHSPGLKTYIAYQPVAGTGWWANLKSWWAYLRIHHQWIKKHGRPDIIHVQIPMKAGLVALWLKWRWNIPYVLTEHYGIYNPYLSDHFKTRPWWYRMATRWVVKHANEFITVSRSLGYDMQQWVYQRNFRVVPNVVDTRLFFYTPAPSTDIFSFVHISNMIPLKNVEGILKTCQRLLQNQIPFQLTLIGTAENRYVEMARESGLLHKYVFFTGVVPYPEVAKAIQRSHAMILFSDTESQSCVTLETLCCGRPAIVTNIGGVAELIEDGVNGFKVPVRDEDKLLEAMEKLITNYHHFNGEKIAAHAAHKYAYPIVGEQIRQLYQPIIGT